jgi:hypothetical protein
MKIQIWVLVLFISCAATVNAQKKYSTNNAVVHFIAVDDNDIDAVNNEAVSRLEANGDLSFILLVKNFKFEMETMQKHFNTEYLESDKFPRAFFSGKISNMNTVNFNKDGKYPITVTGSMQVHGVNKSIQTNGWIEIKNGIVKANAQFTVTLKDFGIGGVLIKMVADKINIDVAATYPQ